MNPHSFDVLILGAGAAGLMAAIEAGRRGRRVAVLERASARAKKSSSPAAAAATSLTSHTRPDNFLSANPHFAKSALARYTPADFIHLVERHGIAWHEKTLGQLFCDGSAQQIVDMLMRECTEPACACFVSTTITEVRRNDSSDASRIVAGNAVYTAPALMVATGGLSIPKIGATAFGHELARQFGIPIEPCRPALVPLTLSGAEHAHFAALAGISAPVAPAASAAFAKRCSSRIAVSAARHPANLVLLEAARTHPHRLGGGPHCSRPCARRMPAAISPRSKRRCVCICPPG